MSDSDLEEQTNELLVLKEICDSECVRLFTLSKDFDENLDLDIQSEFFKKFTCAAKYGGSLDISPNLYDKLKIVWTKDAK